MDFKKPKCQTKTCGKTSQYNEGNSKFCVGCVSTDGRKHASHRRMEHQILSDITRGIKKSLPNSKLFMKYDQVYHDDMRPDLQITNSINDNIVMVEVDENQHFTIENLKKDDSRFKTFYDESKGQGKSLSVVRIVPAEKSKSSMFKKSGNSLYRNNGYLEKNPEHYNKYIKESVSKIVKIISDKQSYRYKDTQVSIGPTVKKNSSSPIFSDTSSPDVSLSTSRARAILKETKDNSESLESLMDALSFQNSNDSSLFLISQMGGLSLNKSSKSDRAKPFSKNQKRRIVDMIQKGQDISPYISGITGQKYRRSNIKLTNTDPIELHLHAIQGAALGYKDSDIIKGVEKLRKESEFNKRSFFKYGKSVSPPALPKKISRIPPSRRNALFFD